MNKPRPIQDVFYQIMRITLAQCLFMGILTSLATAGPTNGQGLLDRRISLVAENQAVKSILVEIEDQTSIVFTYRPILIDNGKTFSFVVTEARLADVLSRILSPDVAFAAIETEEEIVLGPAMPVASISAGPMVESQLAINVSGQVKDESGATLPGVNVVEKGTANGTTTDIDGRFTLSVPDANSILVFSFIGYKTQEMVVGNHTQISVKLVLDVAVLEEVVVVGYGTQKKESVVGSIAQVGEERLKQSGRVTDLKQSLTGNLPGVTTITSSGEPGGTRTDESSTQIFIRGQNTWNGGQPLILVDGVERNMENVDVNEVESISVLKDASATAVFGVKGANGVILITTKRGTVGKPKLSFSYNTTGLLVSRLPEKLDAYNTLRMKNEAIEREVVLNETSWSDYTPMNIVDRYKLPQKPEYAMIYPNVDWENELFKDVGVSHYASMNVQGGTKFTKYFASLAYLHEGDMFKDYDNNKGYDANYNFNRFNFRSNIDFSITPTTTLSVNLAGHYRQKNTNFDFRQNNEYVWQAAYGMPADAYLPRYEDGRWGVSSTIPAETMPNPVASINNVGIRENRWTQLNSDFMLEQKLDFFTKGLSAKGSFFYDNTIVSEGGLNDVTNHVRPEAGGNTPAKYVHRDLYTGSDQDPSEYVEDAPVTGVNQFDWIVRPWTILQEEVSSDVRRRLMYQFQLNYKRKFGVHNVGALALFKREENANGSMFPHFREDWVFRTTYDYDSRYLFEANGAYNGSEQFGPGYRFDFFPSVAAGWVVSNEKFFKPDWINWLKLRYSVGMVGDDRVSGGRWLYASQLAYGGYARMNATPGEESPYKWFKESIVGNPNIHWEKALKSNYGVEVGFLDDLISLTYDYFTEDRTDILLSGSSRPSIPPFYGATSPPSANIGHVEAKGHELEVRFDKRTPNLRYWATFSVTHTQNKILAKDDPVLLPEYSKAEGYAISQTRSQIRAGLYTNWDEIYASVPQESNDLQKLPGFYNIIDFNADGVIKSDDRAPIGYPETPRDSYNASVGFSYKGFSAMVQFYGVTSVSRNIPLKNYNLNQNVLFSDVLDHWSMENPNGSSYLPLWKTQGQFLGDYWIYDGSYIRLKTAEVSYTLQDSFIDRAGLSSMRIFLNGNNLAFWSKLPDDREGAVTGGSAANGAYPATKRITLGIDVTF